MGRVSPKGTVEDLYQYLDGISKNGYTDYDDLCDNSWEMFERSIGYPPEHVVKWAIDRGVKLTRYGRELDLQKVIDNDDYDRLDDDSWADGRHGG